MFFLCLTVVNQNVSSQLFLLSTITDSRLGNHKPEYMLSSLAASVTGFYHSYYKVTKMGASVEEVDHWGGRP